MMTVGQLARRFGLSRTSLLYYDRVGLLKPTARSPAGYRLYDKAAAERLERIRIYRQAGLEIREIKKILELPDGGSSRVLTERIAAIDEEIAGLRVKQGLLIKLLKDSGEMTGFPEMTKEAWVEILARSGMSPDQMDRWHIEFETRSPQAHRSFLLWLGLPEEEVERIRAQSV